MPSFLYTISTKLEAGTCSHAQRLNPSLRIVWGMYMIALSSPGTSSGRLARAASKHQQHSQRQQHIHDQHGRHDWRAGALEELADDPGDEHGPGAVADGEQTGYPAAEHHVLPGEGHGGRVD